MDFVSALIGAGIASVPQVLSHLFGARKDRLARELTHYEARLVAVSKALEAYEGYAIDLREGRALEGQFADVSDKLRLSFGDTFTSDADKAMWASDNGDSYRAIVVRMKAHIADLERKTGVPPRLT